MAYSLSQPLTWAARWLTGSRHAAPSWHVVFSLPMRLQLPFLSRPGVCSDQQTGGPIRVPANVFSQVCLLAGGYQRTHWLQTPPPACLRVLGTSPRKLLSLESVCSMCSPRNFGQAQLSEVPSFLYRGECTLSRGAEVKSKRDNGK